VYPAPGYEEQKTVLLEGEVLFPGTYAISSKNERVSDIIKRAGGLTASAYKDGASLKRGKTVKTQLEQEQETLKLKNFQDMQDKALDSSEVKIDVNDEVVRNDFVGIDLKRILKNPGKSYDLLLEDGDIISIPKQLQTVKVSGEVLSASSVIYKPSSTFKKYILNSGGFSASAYKKRSYITYANGSVEGTKSFLFFRNYPKVKPGSEIFVPFKQDRKDKLSATEVVAISTALATIATLVYTFIK
jgi:protein involved in polysaccharide export with SLBB domain